VRKEGKGMGEREREKVSVCVTCVCVSDRRDRNVEKSGERESRHFKALQEKGERL